MKIETEFNRCQEVWFMEANKPAYSDVVRINISIHEKQQAFGGIEEIKMSYELKNGKERLGDTIFASKQELLDSL